MKKNIIILIWIFYIYLNKIYASDLVPNVWLPWWEGEEIINTSFPKIISNFIQYIAVIAVVTLMISGIMYLVSMWEEEKVKKAKNWVIWSLVWVIISVVAFAIVSFITQFNI